MESIIIKQASLILLAYLVGSIPFGLILSNFFASVNIREKGSKNIGATNVWRVAGPIPGALTLICDFSKGALPVYLAVSFVSSEFFISLIAFLSFLGHLYPVFNKFKGGGKGVATTAGCFCILAPAACSISFLFFFIFLFLWNRVSVASMGSAAILPLSVWIISGSVTISMCAFLMSVFIFIRHKKNIIRILSGKEPVVWKQNI